MTLASCTAPPPPDPDPAPTNEAVYTGAELEAFVRSIEEQLNCTDSLWFADDTYSFPTMKGLSCLLDSGDAAYVRAYESETAARRGLDAVAGLARPGTEVAVAVGENWIVVAPAAVLDRLSFERAFRSLTPEEALREGAAVTPGSEREQRLDFCVGASTSLITERLAGSADYPRLRDETGPLFPGLTERLEQFLDGDPALSGTLEELQAADRIAYLAELSLHFGPVKEACADQVRDSQT